MGKVNKLNKVLQSPFTLHSGLFSKLSGKLVLLSRKAAKIIIKVNAVVEEQIIEEPDRASQAGVQVKLIVRGICCLRPGIPGLSDNIEYVRLLANFWSMPAFMHSLIMAIKKFMRPVRI